MRGLGGACVNTLEAANHAMITSIAFSHNRIELKLQESLNNKLDEQATGSGWSPEFGSGGAGCRINGAEGLGPSAVEAAPRDVPWIGSMSSNAGR